MGGIELNRRQLMMASVAGVTASSWIADGMSSAVGASEDTHYAIPKDLLGNQNVTVIKDGYFSLPIGMEIKGARQGEVASFLSDNGLSPEAIYRDCNLTLFRSGDRLALIDAGAGPLFIPTTGKVLDSLAEAGIDPEEITDVVFTHAHPDHIWGVLDDFDELVFSEATYHISEAEWAFWRSDGAMEAMPEDRKAFVIGANNRFDAIEEAVSFFKPGDEVISGMEAVDTSGHTPGHVSFMLHGGDQPVLVVGDAVNHALISFAHPEWQSGSDLDGDKGAETRAKLLDRLAADKGIMVGFHLAFPGFGQVEKEGSAFRFVTV